MISSVSQLKGQDKIVDFFSRSISDGRIPHAIILSGPRDSGKLTIAKWFAATVMGTDNTENPNIRVIDLYKPETKYVEEIRNSLVDNILLAPYGADHKFYIIAGAGKMPPQAQNAILKSLEEPPEYATIIMLTDDPGKLLPTIRSRSVHLYMKSVENSKIRDHLVSLGCDEAKAQICSSLAQGNLNRAINLMEDEEYLALAEEILEVVTRIACWEQAPAYFYPQIKSFSESMDVFLELMEIIIRDVLVYKTVGEEKVDLPWKKNIAKIATKCSFEHIGRIRKQAAETRVARLSNVSKDVLMELMLIEIGGSIENTGRSAF